MQSIISLENHFEFHLPYLTIVNPRLPVLQYHWLTTWRLFLIVVWRMNNHSKVNADSVVLQDFSSKDPEPRSVGRLPSGYSGTAPPDVCSPVHPPPMNKYQVLLTPPSTPVSPPRLCQSQLSPPPTLFAPRIFYSISQVNINCPVLEGWQLLLS